MFSRLAIVNRGEPASRLIEAVRQCDRLGLTFIGPPAQAERQLGDKSEAKFLAEKTGVPVAAWSGDAVRASLHPSIHVEQDL